MDTTDISNAYNLCIKNYFAASGVPMEYEG